MQNLENIINKAKTQEPPPNVVILAVPPQPHNFTTEVEHIPEVKMVRLTIHRESGVDWLFMPPDYALRISQQLREAANAAKAGIHIASSMIKDRR